MKWDKARRDKTNWKGKFHQREEDKSNEEEEDEGEKQHWVVGLRE